MLKLISISLSLRYFDYSSMKKKKKEKRRESSILKDKFLPFFRFDMRALYLEKKKNFFIHHHQNNFNNVEKKIINKNNNKKTNKNRTHFLRKIKNRRKEREKKLNFLTLTHSKSSSSFKN